MVQQPRRSSFDARFKRLLMAVLAGLSLLLLLNGLFALFVFWLDVSAPLPALTLVVQLLHLLVVLMLDAAIGCVTQCFLLVCFFFFSQLFCFGFCLPHTQCFLLFLFFFCSHQLFCFGFFCLSDICSWRRRRKA
jgi:hypothetical protein